MEYSVKNQTKKPRKRQMSREKRILANRHERQRIRKINDAYEELRSTIPNCEETRVKTKLELLQIATNYIQSLKDHLQSMIGDGHNFSKNSSMYPSVFQMESNGVSKSGPRISGYPAYPPPLPASPPPPSQLSLRHFAPDEAISDGSQFPPPMTSTTDSSTQDFFSLFTSSLNDSHSAEESFFYNRQNAASILYDK